MQFRKYANSSIPTGFGRKLQPINSDKIEGCRPGPHLGWQVSIAEAMGKLSIIVYAYLNR